MKQIVLVLAFAAATANAVTIAPGDIADAPPPLCWGGGGCIATPPPPLTYLLDHDAQQKTMLIGDYIVAFGPNGHLFLSGGGPITEYDTALASVRVFNRPFGSTSAMAVAQSGNVYALSSAGVVTIYSPTAAVNQTTALPFTTGSLAIPPSLDLGTDQCTLFYTDGAQSGRRFDVCTQQPLPDLAPGPWAAVRAMSDGGYVAARQTTLSIFDARNHLMRILAPQIENVTALAFDIDPAYLWAGTIGTVAKIQLSNGARVAYGGVGPLYIAVNGEQRPAAGALATDIPALSPPLLLAVALGLIALAWLRLRG